MKVELSDILVWGRNTFFVFSANITDLILISTDHVSKHKPIHYNIQVSFNVNMAYININPIDLFQLVSIMVI